MKTWAQKRLDELLIGAELPPVIRSMSLGGLEAWGDGWVQKTWTPTPETLNSDGSMFGGMIAALADQILAFAAMTVVPNDKFFRTTGLHLSYFKLSGDTPVSIRAHVAAHTAQVIHVRADFRDQNGNLFADAAAQQVMRSFAR